VKTESTLLPRKGGEIGSDQGGSRALLAHLKEHEERRIKEKVFY
jgi:hypothetical protein